MPANFSYDSNDPYHCHKCGNYYYYAGTGAYFISCPDCDDTDEEPVPERQSDD